MEAESASLQKMEPKVLCEAVARGNAEDGQQLVRTKAYFVFMVVAMMAISAACITWGGRVVATPSQTTAMDDPNIRIASLMQSMKQANLATGYDSCNAPGDCQTPESTGSQVIQNAKNNLGPLGALCGPKHLEFCDDAKKAIIAKYLSMKCDELDALITTGKDALDKLEADFKAFVVTLDKQMEAASPDEGNALLERLREEYKQKALENNAAKQHLKSGLDMVKAVKEVAFTSGNSEL